MYLRAFEGRAVYADTLNGRFEAIGVMPKERGVVRGLVNSSRVLELFPGLPGKDWAIKICGASRGLSFLPHSWLASPCSTFHSTNTYYAYLMGAIVISWVFIKWVKDRHGWLGTGVVAGRKKGGKTYRRERERAHRGRVSLSKNRRDREWRHASSQPWHGWDGIYVPGGKREDIHKLRIVFLVKMTVWREMGVCIG